MKVIALKTFSTGVISMWEGEIREISDADSDYAEYQTLLTEGTCIEEYSEGGGGSGDLTTADVTVVNHTGSDFAPIFIPNCDKTVVGGGEEVDIALPVFIMGNVTVILVAILYKGLCQCSCGEGTKFGTVTGNAEKIDDYMVLITGECTLEFVADA